MPNKKGPPEDKSIKPNSFFCKVKEMFPSLYLYGLTLQGVNMEELFMCKSIVISKR